MRLTWFFVMGTSLALLSGTSQTRAQNPFPDGPRFQAQTGCQGPSCPAIWASNPVPGIGVMESRQSWAPGSEPIARFYAPSPVLTGSRMDYPPMLTPDRLEAIKFQNAASTGPALPLLVIVVTPSPTYSPVPFPAQSAPVWTERLSTSFMTSASIGGWQTDFKYATVPTPPAQYPFIPWTTARPASWNSTSGFSSAAAAVYPTRFRFATKTVISSR